MKLLNNSHSEGFSALSAQPGQPTATIDLSEIVVHTMIVLQCSNNNEAILTLKSLMDTPGLMKVAEMNRYQGPVVCKARLKLNQV